MSADVTTGWPVSGSHTATYARLGAVLGSRRSCVRRAISSAAVIGGAYRDIVGSRSPAAEWLSAGALIGQPWSEGSTRRRSRSAAGTAQGSGAPRPVPLSITTIRGGPYRTLDSSTGSVTPTGERIRSTATIGPVVRTRSVRRWCTSTGLEPGHYARAHIPCSWSETIRTASVLDVRLTRHRCCASSDRLRPHLTSPRTPEPRRAYITTTRPNGNGSSRRRSGERVLEAYRELCALCRLRHAELLDAAHITSGLGSRETRIVSNGLALCKLHHAAFDGFFFTVTPDYRVEVGRRSLTEIDGPMLVVGLQQIDGQLIHLPTSDEPASGPANGLSSAVRGVPGGLVSPTSGAAPERPSRGAALRVDRADVGGRDRRPDRAGLGAAPLTRGSAGARPSRRSRRRGSAAAPIISDSGTPQADAIAPMSRPPDRHGAGEDRRVDAHHPAAELVRARPAGSSCWRVTAIAIAAGPDDDHRQQRERERRREREDDRAEAEGDRARARSGAARALRWNATHSAATVEPTPGRGHQEAEAGRADVEDVVGERRDEHLEVHPERRDEPDDDDGEQDERRRADVAGALGEVLDDRRRTSSGGRSAGSAAARGRASRR